MANGIFGASVFGFLIMLVGGCGGADPAPTTKSSSTNQTGKGTDKTTETSPTTPAPSVDETGTPPEACSPVGAPGNALGVGKYCDGKTAKCSGDNFCTADVGAPEGAWFCSAFCSVDSECGDGAKCFHEARGSACVPNACLDN